MFIDLSTVEGITWSWPRVGRAACWSKEMKKLSRRAFSKGVCLGLPLAGFRPASSRTLNTRLLFQEKQDAGYGELVRDRKGILDLPRDFRYKVISREVRGSPI